MATATSKTEQYRVEYEHSEDYGGQDWHVMSAVEDDGCYGSFETRVEAFKEAKRLNREYEVETLYESISNAVQDAYCDGNLARLRKVAEVLGL